MFIIFKQNFEIRFRYQQLISEGFFRKEIIFEFD